MPNKSIGTHLIKRYFEVSSKGNFEAKMTEVASTKSYFQPEYEYPDFGDCNMDKTIVGVAENYKKGYCQFQMIFSDGSRTSGKNDQDDDEWMDKTVDPMLLDGLRTVEVKYSKDNSRVVGYNWIDKEDVNLL